MDQWTPLIAVHAVAASYSLAIGGLVLRNRPKGSRTHRRLGQTWMVAMYATVLTSFGIRSLHPGHFSAIHLLSVWTFISLTIAWWAARNHRRGLHRGFAIGSYAGLCSAGLMAMAFPQRLAPRLLVHDPLVFAGAVAGVAAAAGLTLVVLRHRTAPPAAAARVVRTVGGYSNLRL